MVGDIASWTLSRLLINNYNYINKVIEIKNTVINTQQETIIELILVTHKKIISIQPKT